MSTADIQARLKALFDATKAIATLTTQLAKWTPESEQGPSSTPLNRSTSSLTQSGTLSRSTSSLPIPTDRVALAADIHQRLKDLEDDYDLLSADAADITAPPARRLDAAAENARLSLTTQLQRLSEDIAHSRSQFRKAQLQAKRTADTFARKERAQLFAGLSDPSDPTSQPPRRRKPTENQGESQLRDVAHDVTEALRRTHQRMQAELQRSEFARDTLRRSNQALQSLSQSYGTLDDFLKTSRGLIQTLSTSNKSDTWYLETALWILVGTVVWLFFRRILYGPIRYLAYIPTKWVLQALYAVVNLVLGLFGVSARAANGVSVSSSPGLSRGVASGKAPTRHPDIPVPSMNVGGGGKGGPPSEARHGGMEGEGKGKQEENLSDQVGKMAEAKAAEEQQASQGTVLRERRADEPHNPKKRMMEEPPIEKDEL